jgi:transcriptional regulator with XRE-family HTH domain
LRARELARAFGRVLLEARLARGLSQEALSERAEFDRTYPSLLERGLRAPSLASFLRLCAALERSPYDLLAATLRAAGTAASSSSGTASSGFTESSSPLRTLLTTHGPSSTLPPAGPAAPRPISVNAAVQLPQPPVRRRTRAHDGRRPRERE